MRARPLVSLAALALAVALPPRALAQAGGDPTGKAAGPRLTPAQQEAVFPDQKALALRHHRERLSAMQDGLRCLENAGNWQALRNCMQQERRNNMEQRRAYWGELRSLYARNGITLPSEGWRQRQGQRQGGGGAGSPYGAPRSVQPGAQPLGGR